MALFWIKRRIVHAGLGMSFKRYDVMNRSGKPVKSGFETRTKAREFIATMACQKILMG